MDSEFVAGVTGAVVGSAISGIISYVLQRQAFRNESGQRQADRDQAIRDRQDAARETDLVGCMTAMMKVLLALNALRQVHEQISEAEQRAEKSGMSLGAAMKAFTADLPGISFDTGELVVISKLGKPALFDDLINLPGLLGLYADTFSAVRRLRMEINELAEDATTLEKGAGTLAFSGSNAAKARLKIHEVDGLVETARALIKHDWPATNNFAFDLQDAFSQRHGRSELRAFWNLKRIEKVPPRPAE